MSILVIGIHTGVGKTFCSTILCDVLGYDYWKPIQAGGGKNSDSVFVQSYVSNKLCHVHPESFVLKAPVSPHHAAALEGVKITLDALKIPHSLNEIIVETAGGVMSPINTKLTNIDLAIHMNLPVVVVSNNYLGSINHTLLTVEILRQHDIKILGLIFNGSKETSSQSFILSYTKLPLLFSIPHIKTIDKDCIQQISHNISIPLL